MYVYHLKRILDFTLALLAIIILLPFLIPITIILLLTGEHKVFYKQTRVGYLNKDFKIWKFATMMKNSSKMGTGSLTLRNDPRVLPFGRFLRRTKINEVPQLINVLKGEMALIGARPQMRVDFEKYSPEVQARIYNTLPGVTGVGSIIFRDEEKWFSEVEGDKHEFDRMYVAPYKGVLEMWYQDNLSWKTDIKLMLLTFWVILRPKSEMIYTIFKTLPPKPEIFKDKHFQNTFFNKKD